MRILPKLTWVLHIKASCFRSGKINKYSRQGRLISIYVLRMLKETACQFYLAGGFACKRLFAYCMFSIRYKFDNKQRTNGYRDAKREAYPHVLNKSRNDKHHA